MILQALYQYQKRQEALGRGQKQGCAEEELKFLIEIAKDGTFHKLTDLREKKRGRTYTLPQAEIRSGKKAYEKPCLLWDTIDFVLGRPKTDSEADAKTAANKLKYFTDRVRRTEALLKPSEARENVRAVLAFYDRNEREKVAADPFWKECSSIPGCKMSFCVGGDPRPVASLPEILDLAGERADKDEGATVGRCLITGEKAPLAVLHPQTPIRGGQAVGKLVGFQKHSGYDSYYKEQGLNAPVSQTAAFKYGTALNTLIGSDTNSFFLAGDTYVFWALPPDEQKETPQQELSMVDGLFKSAMVGFSKKDDPDQGAEKVRVFLDSLRQGKDFTPQEGSFYLLGLSPNAARIAVRLWKSGTIKEFKQNLSQHLNDCDNLDYKGQHQSFTLMRYLLSLTLDGHLDKLPPSLGGNLLDSIVSGAPYPMTLYQQVICRIRAERRVRDEWAGLVKGCLTRWGKMHKYGLGKETFGVAYDSTIKNEGYVLGSLFAVLEKIQSDAMPGVNATIGDRYYGAASSTPAAVFPHLFRMKRFHLKGLPTGAQIKYDKTIGEILAGLGESFPMRLDVVQQGAFALGYYHQRQKLYTKKTVSGEEAPETEPASDLS